MKVYKYDITHALNRVAIVEIPWMAKPLWGGMQDGRLVLWVEIKPSGRPASPLTEKRYVIAAFTGHEFDGSGMVHLNTFTDTNGMVYHVYTS